MSSDSQNFGNVIRLAADVRALTGQLRDLHNDLRTYDKKAADSTERVVHLETMLREIAKRLEQLSTLMTTGNGQPSFQERLTKAQEEISQQRQQLTALRKEVRNLQGSWRHAAPLSRAKFWTAVVTLLTSFLASLAAIAVALIRSFS